MNLGPEVEVEIRGFFPPCPYQTGCHNTMEGMAHLTGGRIIYRQADWRNGKPVVFEPRVYERQVE